MNFVAHLEVGSLVASDRARPDVGRLDPLLVGAALPDLAGIGRFRLEPGGAHGRLAEGIRLHHRTDSVFHADPRVRRLMADLRRSLRDLGVERGPARACGHVGVELLLDGHLLLGDAAAARTDALLATAADPDAEVVAAVPEPQRDRWREHLAVVADRIDPSTYGDPDRVAARLHRILARRRLLAFGEDDVDVVAEALRGAQPQVDDVADALVADVAVSVA